ncbi:MAG: universal stress protein [Lentisphaeraceae bacterium]|nr:universal stress protein [Lentisphaeraceae bacterium]
MNGVNTIMALVDFSKITRKVLDFAASQAKANDAKLVLLHVEPESSEKLYKKIDQKERDRRAKMLWFEHQDLSQKSEELRELGVDVLPLMVEGPEVEGILREVDKIKPDLLVIGHQHHSAWYKFFHESVGDELIDRVTCPMTLIS